MCGRYQFTAAPGEDYRRILRDLQRRRGADALPEGDVAPSRPAPVLVLREGKIVTDLFAWGLPGTRGGLVINARAETAVQRPMFRDSVLARRCVVPTTGFYEWDAARHKYLFQLPGSALLYLAGLYDYVDGQGRYVILTTAPNASMAPIHDRMPLVLQREQIRPWLADTEAALALLDTAPPLLDRVSADGQQSFL